MAATAALRRFYTGGASGSRGGLAVSSLLGGLRATSQQASAIIHDQPPEMLSAEQKEAWNRMDVEEKKEFARRVMTEMEIARTEALVAAPAANPVFTRFADPVPQEMPFSESLAVPETKVTVLPSGLRIASQAFPYTQSATVGVWVDVGSRYETAENNGTAHFLEHMIFKGTKNRSIEKIEQDVENKGAHLNAYTSREQTAYYAKVVKEDVPYAVDLFADILQNSNFEPTRIEWERNVILREMQEIEKKHEEVIFDHLHATAFQHSPLGRTILGSAQNISRINREQIVSYVKSHYTAPRTVIAAAGAVDHDELVKLVAEKFNLPQDPTTAEDLVRKEPSLFTGSEVRIRDDDMPLAHIAIAFKGASWNDVDSLTLMVMQTMLGSWSNTSFGGQHMGSELTQYVAANKLCHSINAFNTIYSDTGLFGLYAVAEKDTLYDLAWVCMNFMTKLVYEVEEDDLVRAKNKLKASFLQQDHSSLAAEDIGRQMLTYGRRMPPEEVFARIDQIDAEVVKKAASRFIYDKVEGFLRMASIQ